MSTFGPSYDASVDEERILTQLERIRDLMFDGSWRTLQEISSSTRDPASSVSAQLRHLRKPKFGGHLVEKRRRGAASRGLWEYRVQKADEPPPQPARPKKKRRKTKKKLTVPVKADMGRLKQLDLFSGGAHEIS